MSTLVGAFSSIDASRDCSASMICRWLTSSQLTMYPRIAIARAEDAVDPGLERDPAEAELGLVRQCGRIAENVLDDPLVFVEAVDRGADDVVDFDVEGLADFVFDAAQRLEGPLVGENDREAGIGHEDVGLDVGQARLGEVKRIQLPIGAGMRAVAAFGAIAHGSGAHGLHRYGCCAKV